MVNLLVTAVIYFFKRTKHLILNCKRVALLLTATAKNTWQFIEIYILLKIEAV